MFGKYGFYVREAACFAAAKLVRRFFSEFAIQVVLTVCGLWCLVTPLLLWVAWTQQVFLGILAAGFASCVIFCIFALGAQGAEGPAPEPGAPRSSFGGLRTPQRRRNWRNSA